MTKKDCFYGIYPIKFIWRGAWNDPELIYKKHTFNYFEIERYLYDIFMEEENGGTFEEWVTNNGTLVKSHLNNLIEMGY